MDPISTRSHLFQSVLLPLTRQAAAFTLRIVGTTFCLFCPRNSNPRQRGDRKFDQRRDSLLLSRTVLVRLGRHGVVAVIDLEGLLGGGDLRGSLALCGLTSLALPHARHSFWTSKAPALLTFTPCSSG